MKNTWIVLLCLVLSGFFFLNKENTSSKTKKIIIKTDKAPLPLGAYSQGILVDKTLYLAGQIGKNPVTNEVQNQNIETETRQVMDNLDAVLKAAEMTMENVIQTTIYLKDIKDFQKVNQIYSSYFKKDFPARETVQVADLANKANIEIAMVAVR